MSNLINQNIIYHEDGADVNEKVISKTINEWIINDVNDEIVDKLNDLYDGRLANVHIPDIEVAEDVIISIVNAYFEPDIDEDYYREGREGDKENYENDIEVIFER